MTETEPFPGIVIDPDTRTYEVCGVRMVVGHLMRSPYRPAHYRNRCDYTPDLAAVIEQVSPMYFTRMAIDMPEAIHAALLCGENGWWVEASVFPDDPEHGYTADLLCGPAHNWQPHQRDADYLLRLWRETCARRDAPPDCGDPNEPGPFAGLEPGTWLWDE